MSARLILFAGIVHAGAALKKKPDGSILNQGSGQQQHGYHQHHYN